jgi:hypothetical protein
MNFINEQHVAWLEVGEQRGQIAWSVDHGPGGLAEVDAKLVSDDVGQRRLAETGRAEYQDMIERLAPRFCGVHEDLQLIAYSLLANVVAEALGANGPIDRLVVGGRVGGGDVVVFYHGPLFLPMRLAHGLLQRGPDE